MSEQEIFTRLFLSLVLSGVIGLERGWTNKPAGFRTHILVGTGSALIMLSSVWIAQALPDKNIDPSRIAAQVVTGIGFLGGGVIIYSGGSVHGLTTAASLWMVSGIGLATGMGFYSGALWGTSFALFTLLILDRVSTSIRTLGWTLVSLDITAELESLPFIQEAVQQSRLKLSEINIVEKGRNKGEVKLTIKDVPQSKAEGFKEKLWKIKGMKIIEWG